MVVLLGLLAPEHLALNADRFIDEEQHRAEKRPREVPIAKFLAQFGHLIVKHLQTLDLHLRARKAVDDHALFVFRVQQFV